MNPIGHPSLSTEDQRAPREPDAIEDTGLDPCFLHDLALKHAYHEGMCTSSRVAEKLCLPLRLTDHLLQWLRKDHLVALTAQVGPDDHRYEMLDRGAERVKQLLDVSGYVGPAPVSLAAYRRRVEATAVNETPPPPEKVARALDPIVIPDASLLTAGLALSSGRSLFLFGPPGNGKTSIARLIHDAFEGDIWVPHAIEIDGQVIKVYDPHVHARSKEVEPAGADRRWVRIRRPLVVVGGELTMESMDLIYSRNLRFYEAPFQLKANGGTLVIDDFGRQRVDSSDLINRWITPLENGRDFLTLATGKTIEVPFRQFLIFVTNLPVEKIVDQVFLRRIGYRLRVDPPTEEIYRKIFERCAWERHIPMEPEALDALLAHYRQEGRPLRGSEPSDLLDRVLDIQRYAGLYDRPLGELLDLAWANYFGQTQLVEKDESLPRADV